MTEYPTQGGGRRRELDQDVSEAIALAEGTHDGEVAIARALEEDGDRLDALFDPSLDAWDRGHYPAPPMRPSSIIEDRSGAALGFTIIAGVAVFSFLAGWFAR